MTDNMKQTGVYAIKNTANGKLYIGSAAGGFRRRWNLHLCQLRRGIHDNRYLQRAWDKWGEDSFVFVILTICEPCFCITNEQHFIDNYQAANRRYGYNLSPTAGSALGCKHSAESRMKMSVACRGKPKSAETRLKISLSKLGKPMNREAAARSAASRRGLKWTPERRRQASLRMMGNSRSRGVIRSQEYRLKLSLAKRGRKLSPEHNAKCHAPLVGQKRTPEQIERIRRGMALSIKRKYRIKVES